MSVPCQNVTQSNEHHEMIPTIDARVSGRRLEHCRDRERVHGLNSSMKYENASPRWQLMHLGRLTRFAIGKWPNSENYYRGIQLLRINSVSGCKLKGLI